MKPLIYKKRDKYAYLVLIVYFAAMIALRMVWVRFFV